MANQPPSPEALRAHLISGLIEATASPNETPETAHLCMAIVIQALQALAPANVMEAMTACHIVSLQYVYDNALRALSAAAGDETAQARLRAQVNTLSRTLQQWHARHEATQLRREKREAAEREAAEGPRGTGNPSPDARQRPADAPVLAQGRTSPEPSAAIRKPSPPAPSASPLSQAPVTSTPIPPAPMTPAPMTPAPMTPASVPPAPASPPWTNGHAAPEASSSASPGGG